ncbi:hypothetical protein KY331_06145 [Candidatus Woesearchaeota archaeon]|nr:hypothetical protein [Candidatus Woesearchaeota archaeon]
MPDEKTFYITVPQSKGSDTAVISDASREVEEITNNHFLAELISKSLREAMKSGTPIDRIEKEIVIDNIPWTYKVASDRKGGHIIAFKKLEDPDEIGRRQLEALAVKLMRHLCHDVRGLLTSIIGRCELFGREYNFSDSDREILNGILDTSNEIVMCCNTYMDWSRNPNPQLTTVDVNQSLDRIVSGTRKMYKDVEIVKDYTEDLPQINANYGLLDRLWHNLLSNACESTENTGRLGRVVVSTGMYGSDLVKVCFEDNGAGMNQTALAVWKSTASIKPFSTKEKGKGEGRSIVMDVMRRNNAEHSVDSKEGKGTKISVYFKPIYE